MSDKQSDNCSGAPPARRYGETSLHKLGDAPQDFKEAKAPVYHEELTEVQHRLQSTVVSPRGLPILSALSGLYYGPVIWGLRDLVAGPRLHRRHRSLVVPNRRLGFGVPD